MSREILKLVQKIDSSTVDLQMVLQCAPVLAGLKVSNMLSVSRAFYPRILEVLKETDISCYLLRQTDEKVILLLYKEQELQQQLLEADTRAFLKSYGYTQFAVEDVLDLFKKRYCDNLCTTKDFPHEMGVLLGYPLEDVKGFINNRGRNFLYTGYWKAESASPRAAGPLRAPSGWRRTAASVLRTADGYMSTARLTTGKISTYEPPFGAA